MKAQIKPPTRWVYEALGRQQVAAKGKRVLGPDGKPVQPMEARQQMNRKARRIIRFGAAKIQKHFHNLPGKKKHQTDPFKQYVAQRDAEILARNASLQVDPVLTVEGE